MPSDIDLDLNGVNMQLLLHSNYSTSVKGRGPYYHSASYFRSDVSCASRAIWASRGSSLGLLVQIGAHFEDF